MRGKGWEDDGVKGKERRRKGEKRRRKGEERRRQGLL